MKIQLPENAINTLVKALIGLVIVVIIVIVGATTASAPSQQKSEVNPLMQEIQDWKANRVKTQADSNAMAIKDCEDIQAGSKLMIAGAGLDYIEASSEQYSTWLSQKDWDCSKAKYSLGF